MHIFLHQAAYIYYNSLVQLRDTLENNRLEAIKQEDMKSIDLFTYHLQEVDKLLIDIEQRLGR